jgi:hypothetical protein
MRKRRMLLIRSEVLSKIWKDCPIYDGYEGGSILRAGQN